MSGYYTGAPAYPSR